MPGCGESSSLADRVLLVSTLRSLLLSCSLHNFRKKERWWVEVILNFNTYLSPLGEVGRQRRTGEGCKTWEYHNRDPHPTLSQRERVGVFNEIPSGKFDLR